MSWGVSAVDASRVVDQIYDAQAAPRWSPNYRVLSIEAGGGTSAEKIARLDSWLSEHGIAPINPPSPPPPPPPPDFITSPAVMRQILADRGGIFAALAPQFTDQVIGDLLFLHDQTGVQRSFLETVDEGTLGSLLSLGQQYAQSVTNLIARVEIPDPVHDPGFLSNIVKAIWKTNDPNFLLTSIPLKPIDDISEFVLSKGIWGPLFPLPTGPDWEEPIESPAVVAAMVNARWNIGLTSPQVLDLYDLYGISSVPASFVSTLGLGEAIGYKHRAEAFVTAISDLVSRGRFNLGGGRALVVIEPSEAREVVIALFRAGLEPANVPGLSIPDLDARLLDQGSGGILWPIPGDTDWFTGIVDERVIAVAVREQTGVAVTVEQVNLVEDLYGWEDRINFEGIRGLTAELVQEILGGVGAPPPPPPGELPSEAWGDPIRKAMDDYGEAPVLKAVHEIIPFKRQVADGEIRFFLDFLPREWSLKELQRQFFEDRDAIRSLWEDSAGNAPAF